LVPTKNEANTLRGKQNGVEDENMLSSHHARKLSNSVMDTDPTASYQENQYRRDQDRARLRPWTSIIHHTMRNLMKRHITIRDVLPNPERDHTVRPG